MPSIEEPGQFAATKQSGTARKFVISLTDKANTWLIGNFDGEWTDGHVYHLCDKFSFTGAVDLFENTWRRATVNLNIVNLPYTSDSNGTRIRLSDQVSGSAGNAAAIYVTMDPYTTVLSDCECIFNGITRKISSYTTKNINIVLEDNGYVVDTVVLTTGIEDVI